jgi:hypothetical protein
MAMTRDTAKKSNAGNTCNIKTIIDHPWPASELNTSEFIMAA